MVAISIFAGATAAAGGKKHDYQRSKGDYNSRNSDDYKPKPKKDSPDIKEPEKMYDLISETQGLKGDFYALMRGLGIKEDPYINLKKGLGLLL